MPGNLWLCAGGSTLVGVCEDADVARAGELLRGGIEALGDEWVMFADTDAELAERVASRIALAATARMVLLLSSSWNDYTRTLDDPINGVFAVLQKMEETGVRTPAIEMVLFNHVKQKSGAAIKLHSTADGFGRDATLPFSPVKNVQSQMAQISDHLFSAGWVNAERDWKRFYVNGGEGVEDEGVFSDTYVTALFELPDNANHASQLTGTPICSMDSRTKFNEGTDTEFKVSKDSLEKCQGDVAIIAGRLP